MRRETKGCDFLMGLVLIFILMQNSFTRLRECPQAPTECHKTARRTITREI